MKKILSLLLLSLAAIAARAEGDIDAKWFKEHYVKAEYMIPMRDGVRLYTAVFTPKNKRGGDHPILYMRTPYGCAPYGKKNADFWKQSIYRNYLEAEYIFVFQDVRGRWMSEGEFVNVRPFIANKQGRDTDEASDVYDSVEWLLRKVRKNNGKVGVYGNSYCGFYALMAAASGHPAVCAVSPQAPVGDWFMGDDFHHNGAFAVCDAVSFLPHFGTTGRVKPTDKPVPFESPAQGGSYDYFMTHTVADITAALGGRVPFWDDMTAHPDYDEWWRQRSAMRATENVTSPILMVGGAFDAEDAYGVWNIYRALRANNPSLDCRIVVGPWAHGAWRGNGGANELGGVVFSEDSMSEFFRDEIEFPFFDYLLRGEGDGGASSSGALVFFSGENCWRESEGWSPERECEPSRLYIDETGALRDDAPDAKSSYSVYTSDPSDPVPYYPDTASRRKKEYMVAGQEFVDSRDDVLAFVSPVLEEDVTMAGAIEAVLYAAISTTDADFVVKVIDVGPDGEYEMLVRGDIMRGRYRNGFSTPEAFTPDRIERVAFTMPDVAHTFMAGHRIKVQIQSSWFPLFDRNPQQAVDIYKCSASDFVPCDVKIYHDADHPSHIAFYRMK